MLIFGGKAPYVYLYSQERFLPGDIGEQYVVLICACLMFLSLILCSLRHTIPYLNYSPITSYNNHQSLKNLAELNQFGTNVYLTSDDDPEHPPEWLRGDRNKPISPGSDDDDLLGMSAAPGIIIWVEKGEGIVDAFYFYFYSFNLGNKVAGWRFGNHVGDWEHNAVRFVNGLPESVFYSEHSGGAAYEYQAVEKIGLRVCSSLPGYVAGAVADICGEIAGIVFCARIARELRKAWGALLRHPVPSPCRCHR